MNSCRSGFVGKALLIRLLFASILVGLVTVCVSSDYAFAEFRQFFKKKRIVYEEAKDDAKRVSVARCLGSRKSGPIIFDPSGIQEILPICLNRLALPS